MTRRTDNVALKKAKERRVGRGETPRTVEAAKRAGEAYARQQAVLAPWERGAIFKQRDIKAAYAAVSVKLAASTLPEDRALATKVTAFVADMPGPLSHRLSHAEALMSARKRNEINDRDLKVPQAKGTAGLERDDVQPIMGKPKRSDKPERSR